MAAFLVLQLTVAPRLEARNTRIKAAHAARHEFSDRILTILAASGRLRNMTVPDEVSEPVRGRLEAERERWCKQIDDATMHLIDNAETFVLGYPNRLGLHQLLNAYVVATRGAWLSDSPDDDRVRVVQELTEAVQGVFFANLLWRVRHLTRDLRRLQELLSQGSTPE